MVSIHPFADDVAAAAIGDLKIENNRDKVALYGSLDLTRDKNGLARARALQTLITEVIGVLETDQALPDAIAPPPAPTRVKNPFA